MDIAFGERVVAYMPGDGFVRGSVYHVGVECIVHGPKVIYRACLTLRTDAQYWAVGWKRGVGWIGPQHPDTQIERVETARCDESDELLSGSFVAKKWL